MSDVLDFVKEQVKLARAELEKAKKLVKIMKEAGEDTAELELHILELERKIAAYEKALGAAK